MQHFHYSHGALYAESVPIADIVNQYGTPCYVYSRQAIEWRWKAYEKAFGHRAHKICYAVKANDRLAILNLLARLGSGFDIVSSGELKRVLAAGGNASQVIFSGVGKRTDEIQIALEVGIHSFNVESASELKRIQSVASALGVRASVALRVNPNVDAETHPHISTGLKENKFGIEWEEALALYEIAQNSSHIQLTGVHCHIGSQITNLAPYKNAFEKMARFVRALEERGLRFDHINLGGGLGIAYRADEAVPSVETYIAILLEIFKNFDQEFIIEPGRSIVGDAGMLVTKIEYLKKSAHKNFAVVDAAMNDLLRPALYHAWHEIMPVVERENVPLEYFDIVGPVCESADTFARHRPLRISEGDNLAIASVGAYGAVMASNYNARPLPAEVMVDGEKTVLIRPRQPLEDLYAAEQVLKG